MRNCADSVNRYISFLAGTQTTNEFLNGIIQLPNLHAINPMDPNELPRGATLSKKRAKGEDGEDEKPKKRKREKKEKDPNAPKRPPSAYIFFQNAVRQQMRENNPDLPYRELVTKIAERWGALPADEKKVYSDMAANEMDKWRTDTADYTRANAETTQAVPASEGTEDEDDEIEDIPVQAALHAVAKGVPAPAESSSDSDESEAEAAPPPPPPSAPKSSKKSKAAASSQPAPTPEVKVKSEKKAKKSKA